MSEDRFHSKPWRVDWFDPELEHRKYQKAFREDDDYSEEVNLYFGDWRDGHPQREERRAVYLRARDADGRVHGMVEPDLARL